jgi:hypothetical protein
MPTSDIKSEQLVATWFLHIKQRHKYRISSQFSNPVSCLQFQLIYTFYKVHNILMGDSHENIWRMEYIRTQYTLTVKLLFFSHPANIIYHSLSCKNALPNILLFDSRDHIPCSLIFHRIWTFSVLLFVSPGKGNDAVQCTLCCMRKVNYHEYRYGYLSLCTETKIPFMYSQELRRLSPNFHIHVSVSDLCGIFLGSVHIFSCSRKRHDDGGNK